MTDREVQKESEASRADSTPDADAAKVLAEELRRLLALSQAGTDAAREWTKAHAELYVFLAKEHTRLFFARQSLLIGAFVFAAPAWVFFCMVVWISSEATIGHEIAGPASLCLLHLIPSLALLWWRGRMNL